MNVGNRPTFNGKQITLETHIFNFDGGDCIALVGLSGSGKSTLVHMIPRFWNPTKGRILLDGIDIRDLKLESLRRHIAIVSQDVMIFDDTRYSSCEDRNRIAPDRMPRQNLH